MHPSPEELLDIARSYWRPDKNFHFKLENSPETRRLQELWERQLANAAPWKAFLDDLEKELPGLTVGDATATCDAALRCAVYPRRDEPRPRFRWVVVGCISIIAPVYTVYAVRYEYAGVTRIGEQVYYEPFPPNLKATTDVLGRRIEATFQLSVLPRDIADTPIPLFVEPREPPHTTLFHALFTSQPERVP